MNWEAVGAVGEMAGAVGVIVTLAYLARQMRVNTIALQNETIRDSMQMVIDSYSTVIADEDVAAIYLRGMQDFNALSDVEQIRFHYVCCQRLHAASTNKSFMNVNGGGSELAEVIGPWISRMMQREGFRQWWEQRGRAIMTPEFAQFADAMREQALMDA